MKELYVFDIDDTLLKTTSLIHEMDNGEVVKTYTTEDWRHLKVEEYKGASAYDWSNISCSDTFRSTAIKLPAAKFYRSLYYKVLGTESRIILMTGRQPMTCMTKYRQTFHDHEIPINGVEIFMAGRYMQNSPKNKMIELLSYLVNNPGFEVIHMYDDDPKNFREVTKLDHFKVIPYLVKDGKIEKLVESD